MVSIKKTSFYINLQITNRLLCGQRALESVLQKVTLSCVQGIFLHSWCCYSVREVQATFEVDFTKF